MPDGNNEIREVLIRVTLDQNAAKEVDRWLDSLENRLNSVLSGMKNVGAGIPGPRGGLPTASPAGAQQPTAVPFGTPITSQGMTGGPVPLSDRGMAAGGPGGIPGDVQTIVINAQTVILNASNVQNGGGFSGGGGPTGHSQAGNAPAAAGGGGGGQPDAGGSGSFWNRTVPMPGFIKNALAKIDPDVMAAIGPTLANISRVAGPVSMAAIPALLIRDLISQHADMEMRQLQFGVGLESMTTQAYTGSGPGYGYATRLAQERMKASPTAEGFQYRMGGAFLTRMISGVFGMPSPQEFMDAELAKQLEMDKQGEIFRQSVGEAQRFTVGSRATISMRGRFMQELDAAKAGHPVQRFGMFPGSPGTTYEINDQEIARAAARLAAANALRFSPFQGGLAGSFESQIAGTVTDEASKNLLIQEANSYNGIDFGRRPQYWSMRNDRGSLKSAGIMQGMAAAASGDISGAAQMIAMLGPVGGKMMADILGDSLTRERATRFAQYDVSGAGIAASVAGTGRELALLGGATPYQATTAEQRGAVTSQSIALQTQINTLIQKRVTQLAFDPEGARQTELQIQELQGQRQSLSLQGIQLQRSDVEAQYGYRSSVVGLSEAAASRQASFAGLFGGPQSQFAARQSLIGVAGEQIGAEQERLSGMYGRATPTEINAQIKRITELTTGMAVQIEQSFRDLYQGLQRIAGFQYAGLSARGGVLQDVYGSGATLGNLSSRRGNVQGRIANAQDEINRAIANGADPKGDYVEGLKANLEGMKAEQVGQFALDYRPDYDTRRSLRNVNAYMAITSGTAAGQGDIRGAAAAQMNLASKQLADVEAQHTRALAEAQAITDPTQRDAAIRKANESYDITKQQIVLGQALPAQQMLEMGWQERLISSVVGANGNFNMVASSFTRREAGMFYGIKNRAFGGMKEDVDKWRSEAGMFYNTIAGANTPEGFVEQGMSGATGGRNPGEVKLVGGLDVNITISQDGNIIDQQRRNATIGRDMQQLTSDDSPPSFFGG